MTPTDRLAALLHERHIDVVPNLCYGCEQEAARLIAAGVTLDPQPDIASRVIDVDAWLPQHLGYCANRPEDECSCGVGPEYERMLATAYAAPRPAPDTALREAIDRALPASRDPANDEEVCISGYDFWAIRAALEAER